MFLTNIFDELFDELFDEFFDEFFNDFFDNFFDDFFFLFSDIRRNSHGSSSKPKPKKDSRTQCDKCDLPGSNNNLVRCDECQRCYHFGCLIPPVTKSPKRPGWGWHCNECDPSDASDWHLD